MPRVGRNQYSDRSKLAVKAVNPESAKNFKHNTVQIAKPTSILPLHERIHTFTNCLTGNYETLSNSQILEKAQAYICWAREHKGLPLKSTFWRSHGITREQLMSFCQAIPGLKDLVDVGGEYCGDVRDNKLEKYLAHISKMQSVYVPEYKEYDKEMIEFKERVRNALEKEESQTPAQLREVINAFLEPIFIGMEKRGRADKSITDERGEQGKTE